MKLLRPLLLTLIIIHLSLFISHATITINSVNLTNSTCTNNGTATIFASSSSNNAVFLYNIVSGPVLYPLQNDSIFKSLYPGTYTARVHDVNSFDSAQTTFTITSSYTPLVLSPTPIAPSCGTGNKGEIIANINGTGLSPYSWQITSPFTGSPQASDTFGNLAPGTYIIKVTDACSNATTQSVVLPSGTSGFALQSQSLSFTGCDTGLLTVEFSLNASALNQPLKVTITTKAGTVINNEMPLYDSNTGFYYILDTVYHITFGSPISICIADQCNSTYCLPVDSVNAFNFFLYFNTVSGNCTSGTGGTVMFEYNTGNELYADPYDIPLTAILTNPVTHAVLDSITFYNYCQACANIPPQPQGTYLLTVKDPCGDVSQHTVYWPPPVPSNFTVYSYYGSCIDSIGVGVFTWNGFGSNLTIQLLSGPSMAHSTKPGFTYSDTIIYPITNTNVQNTGVYNIDGLPAGKYTYLAFDSCGNTFMGSFDDTIVSSLALKTTYARNCGNLNTLYVDIGNGNTEYFLQIKSGNTVIETVSGVYGLVQPVTSLPPGQYVTQVFFTSEVANVYIHGLPKCWNGTTTLVIPPVNDSTLKATDVATCNGVIYIQIEADTNNGVPPFKYEIINGPETFALQYSNLFTVSTYGTYTVGIMDSCGNVVARQISIDTGKFSPVVKAGGWCQGSAATLIEVASPFFSYLWYKPDGTTYTGDTLVIDPFTETDTGIYQITKIVNINGCQDSAVGSYYLVFRDTFRQSVSICPGDTLLVGPYIHTTGGVYADTLTGVDGCDSIEVSALTLLASPQAAITPAEPPVCHTGATILTASGGITYTWSPGNYNTGTITVNPQVTTIYTVIVGDTSVCSSKASATVYPPADSVLGLTQSKTIFCSDDSAELCAPPGFTSYQWSGGITGTGDCVYVRQAGDYYVMATDSNGCNIASNHLSVSVYPVPSVSIIRQGDTLASYGQVHYQWLLNDNPVSGATSQVFIASQPGSYSVEITDTNGCTIISSPLVVSGINNLEEEESVILYPNPSSAASVQLAVSSELVGSALEIFDDEGRLVFQSKISLLKSKIDLEVASGVYYLRISNERVSVVRKLVRL